MIWQVRDTRSGRVQSRWLTREEAQEEADYHQAVVVEPASGRLRLEDPEGSPVVWTDPDGSVHHGTYTGGYAPMGGSALNYEAHVAREDGIHFFRRFAVVYIREEA